MNSSIPETLRGRLESVRLELLALFRALDRLHLAPSQLPQIHLQELFELDADFAEALWALDQPSGALDVQAMLRDTRASLDKLKSKRQRFVQKLPDRGSLEQQILAIRSTLTLEDAYCGIPGRDPTALL